MTDQNNAAQPGLTDDQIEALAKKHIAPHADRLEAIMTNPVPYQQTEQFRRVKALIWDLLSKLRAEGVQAGEPAFYINAAVINPETGRVKKNIQGALTWSETRVGGWQMPVYTRAALSTAPVAGEAQERIEQMAVNRYRPVPDGKFSYKVVAGDGSRSLYTGTKDSCLRVAAKLTEAFLDGAFVASDAAPQASAPVADAAPEYTYSDDGRTVTMTNADRAPSYQTSAPVAGEAREQQQRVAYTDSCGHLHWTNGRKILTSLYAGPWIKRARHPDDAAVDRFAVAMKAKLAKKRADGRGGWQDKTECSAEFLSELLRGHVEKGDPLDVGNFAMMLHQREERIAALVSTPVADDMAEVHSLTGETGYTGVAPAAPVAREEQKPIGWARYIKGYDEPDLFLPSDVMGDPTKKEGWTDDVTWLPLVLANAAPQASTVAGEAHTALNEWFDKTDFIQKRIASGELPVKYLGWHRADVMRDLIDAASRNQELASGHEDDKE